MEEFTEQETTKSPWGTFLLFSIVCAPLLFIFTSSIFTKRAGFAANAARVSNSFRAAAVLGTLWAAAATFLIVAFFYPSVLPISCSQDDVTALAKDIFKTKVAELSNEAAIDISAIRTRAGARTGVDCGARIMVDNGGTWNGNNFILYHVERTDDGKSIYMTVTLDK